MYSMHLYIPYCSFSILEENIMELMNLENYSNYDTCDT